MDDKLQYYFRPVYSHFGVSRLLFTSTFNILFGMACKIFNTQLKSPFLNTIWRALYDKSSYLISIIKNLLTFKIYVTFRVRFLFYCL